MSSNGEEAPCLLCLTRESSNEIKGFYYCSVCADAHPYLISGINVHTTPSSKLSSSLTNSNPSLHALNENFVLPIEWHNLIGLHDTSEFTDHDPTGNIDEICEEIEYIVSRMGSKEALTFLVLMRRASEMVAGDGFTSKDAGLPPRMWEFSIALVGSMEASYTRQQKDRRIDDLYEMPLDEFQGGYHNSKLKAYDPEAKQLIQCLEKLYSIFNATYDPFGENGLDEDSQLSSAAQDSELIYGAFAYTEQYIETLERLFAPYQLDFLEYFDIDMIKSSRFSSNIADLHFKRIEEVTQDLRYYEVDCLRLLGALAKGREKDRQISELLDSEIYGILHREEIVSWEILTSKAERRLWITQGEIINILSNFNKYRVEKFLDRISVSVGEFEHDVSSPFGFNQLEKNPLLKLDDSYLIADPVMFSRALAKTFYHDLRGIHKDDDEELNLEFGKRGIFLEEWVHDLVHQLFSEEENAIVYHEVEPDENPNLELDVVAIHDSTALIFEVKSKYLTDKARKGDIDRIKDDLDKGILSAVDQLDTRIRKLEKGEISINDTSKNIKVDRDIDEFLPIVILGGQYDRIATQEYVTQIPEQQLIPYVASVYDLDIISHIIPEHVPVEQFEDFIPKRIKAVEYGQIKSVDEIDFFGAGLTGALDVYDESGIGRIMEESADFSGFNVHANIGGADEIVRQLLPEYELKYYTEWLTSPEVP